MAKTTQKGTKKKGGKRAGAGRPQVIKNHSEQVKRNYQIAAEIIEAETGMTVEEHFLRAAIDPDLHPGSRAAFAKLYNEALLIKESKQTVENTQKPVVYLPEVIPKPKDLEKNQVLHG